MSNMLFMCRLPEHVHPKYGEPDKTLLRVYFNPETESHLVAESVIFTLLSERHLGPRLYGIFNGGRLEEYIPVGCFNTFCITGFYYIYIVASAKLFGDQTAGVIVENCTTTCENSSIRCTDC
jgi:hypothetical protein